MQEEILETTESTKTGTGTGTTSAIMIANPTAGSYVHSKEQIEETLSYLRDNGWQIDLRLTEAAGDAGHLAHEAVERHLNVVVAVGGDGTINEVIQELAGSETALGVLPSGTVNVWARETGIPLENKGAREVLVHGRMRRIDLGCLDGRYFLLMAGIGLDGEVTQAVEKKPMKRFGVLSYVLLGTWFGLGYANFPVILELGEHIMRARVIEIVIGNTQLYGGAIKFTSQAQCDDGLLDVCIIRKQSRFGRIGVAFDFLLHRKQRRQSVLYETCQTIKIHTYKPVAIQIDGDPAGYTNKRGLPPTTFTISAGALKVLVPQSIPEGLFSKE